MKKLINFYQKKNNKFLSSLALAASITAKIGAGTASSWGSYQPSLPKELSR